MHFRCTTGLFSCTLFSDCSNSTGLVPPISCVCVSKRAWLPFPLSPADLLGFRCEPSLSIISNISCFLLSLSWYLFSYLHHFSPNACSLFFYSGFRIRFDRFQINFSTNKKLSHSEQIDLRVYGWLCVSCIRFSINGALISLLLFQCISLSLSLSLSFSLSLCLSLSFTILPGSSYPVQSHLGW